VLLFVVAPAALSPFRLDLLGKYLCYAIVAVGIGLAWGRGGMLTLGQGVFFGIGAYLMAMHLKLADAGPAAPPTSWPSSPRTACRAGGNRSGPAW
jgi:urea transport system permease protein